MTTEPTVVLSYHVAGPVAAPWLTFIPGIGNDATFWLPQAQELSADFRVLTFDPWGHGDSPAPPRDYRFTNLVQSVVRLWDRLRIERSSVVGLGFGGSMTLAIGLAAPGRVERLVACCCRARQPEDRREFWRKRLEAAKSQGMAALADATVDRWLSPEFRARRPDVDARLRTMMKSTTLEGYCAYVSAFIEMDFDDRLHELCAPTLLLAAEHDHGGGPVDSMRDMAARIPGARLEVIAGCGHICNHEAPGTVTGLLREFLSAAR